MRMFSRLLRAMFGAPAITDHALALRLRRARLAVWGILMMGAGMALWGRYTELSSRPRPIRTTDTAAGPAVAPAPEVRFLLTHSEELGLTEAQQQRIAALQAKWERASAGLREAGVQAADAAKRSGGARATQEAIQRASAPVVVVSAELVRLRRAYWDAAVGALSAPQRDRLRPLMKRITLADLLPATGQEGVGSNVDARRR